MRANRLTAIAVVALFLTSCGDDGGGVSVDPADDPAADPTSVAGDLTGDEGSDEGVDQTVGDQGTGTVTIGETTWTVAGTCNSPLDGVVLLTGTSTDDPGIEIYLTATPSMPDTASAYVTDGGGAFDWSAGGLDQFDIERPETSYEGGVARGSAVFIDFDQPTLEPTVAEGSWEFRCE